MHAHPYMKVFRKVPETVTAHQVLIDPSHVFKFNYIPGNKYPTGPMSLSVTCEIRAAAATHSKNCSLLGNRVLMESKIRS